MNLKNIMTITKDDSLNFISPFGLGDTMFLNMYRKALEKKYCLPIRFIIKPSHRAVMKMFGNNDYSVHEFSAGELKGIAKDNTVPKKGMLYVAHPGYSDTTGLMEEWLDKAYEVNKLWIQFLGLDENTPPDQPSCFPSISGKYSLPDPSKSVLLLPEAHSVSSLKPSYWKKIAKTVQKDGLIAVQSCVNPKNRIKGIPVLPDDLDTVIAFALACRKVYSLRSGFCDLIANQVKDITLFYPDKFSFNVYILEKQFPEQHLTNKLVKTGTKKYLVKRFARWAVKKFLVTNWIEQKIEQKFGECYNDVLLLARKI